MAECDVESSRWVMHVTLVEVAEAQRAATRDSHAEVLVLVWRKLG